MTPDFPTGGLIDCSKYNRGLRGGVLKVRARITKTDKKTLVITEIPYGKNTTTLIDTIVKANEKGKIKIYKGTIQELPYLSMQTEKKYPRDLKYFQDIYLSFKFLF